MILRQAMSRRSFVYGLGGVATVFAFPATAQKVWATYRNERFEIGRASCRERV